MQNLTCSLVALAILAMRNGNYADAAKLFGQASVSPDAECFLEDVLAHNLEARALVSASSAGGLQNAVKAMSSAFQLLGEEDSEEEFESMSFGNDVEDLALAEELDATYSDGDHDLQDEQNANEDQVDAETLGEDQDLESGIQDDNIEVMTLSSCSGLSLKIKK